MSGLARRACMTQPHVSNILNGRRRFSLETADAVMLALGITTEELLERAMDAEGRCA